MSLTLGTFNLKNLFSRYNFEGEVGAIETNETSLEGAVTYSFSGEDRYRIRTYKGKLVKAKDPVDVDRIVDRILRIDVDVLAIQEAEDIDTLRQFNRERLKSCYPHIVLVEGNDPRLIDVGLLSKYPIGAVTSWQRTVHPDQPGELVFGRDLLEVDILNLGRTKVLFKLFNSHLKSHFVPYDQDQAAGEVLNTNRRRKQAEMIAKIVKDRTRPDSRYAIVGDMNDPVDSVALLPFTADPEMGLTDSLETPQETRPPKEDESMPATAAWTVRHKPESQPAIYSLYDQIWLSPKLEERRLGSWIDRRERHGGDGSDHDPAWVKLEV